jgi:hypothetical protein
MRVVVTDRGDGAYELAYEPSQSGTYALHVSLGALGHRVAGTPLVLRVEPAHALAAQCEAHGSGLTCATTGEEASFRLTAVGAQPRPLDADGADGARGRRRSPPGRRRSGAAAAAAAAGAGLWAGGVRVELVALDESRDAAASRVRGAVVEVTAGVLEARYTPLVAGAHALAVTVTPARGHGHAAAAGAHVPGSPFTIDVLPARADAAMSEARWSGEAEAEGGSEAARGADGALLIMVAGRAYPFELVARDRHGNRCERGDARLLVSARRVDAGAHADGLDATMAGADADGADADGADAQILRAPTERADGSFGGEVRLLDAGEYELLATLQPPSGMPRPLGVGGRVRARVRGGAVEPRASVATGAEALLRVVAGERLCLRVQLTDALGNAVEDGAHAHNLSADFEDDDDQGGGVTDGRGAAADAANDDDDDDDGEREVHGAPPTGARAARSPETPRWEALGGGQFELRWRELRAGRRKALRVALRGAAVAGSPFALRVRAAEADAPSCVLRWLGQLGAAAADGALDGALAGEVRSAELRCFDRFGNAHDSGGVRVRAALSAPTQAGGDDGGGGASAQPQPADAAAPHQAADASDVTVADLKNGLYLLTLAPRDAGRRELSATVDGRGPVGTLRLEVRALDPHAPSCALTVPASVVAGQPLRVGVECRDRFSNRALVPAAAAVGAWRGGDGDGESESFVLGLDLALTEPVDADGAPRALAPPRVECARGKPLARLRAGGAEGGHLLRWALGAREVDACVTVERRACVSVSLTLRGRHVAGSPAVCDVVPAQVDAARCAVSGGALRGAVAGAAGAFAVELRDGFGNALELAAHEPPPLLGRITLLQPEPGGAALAAADATNAHVVFAPAGGGGNGSLAHGRFVARVAGEYSLELFALAAAGGLAPVALAGCPLRVRVEPAETAARACTVAGPGLARSLAVGARARATLTARDAYGNARRRGGDVVELALSGPARGRALAVADRGDGSYEVSWELQAAGAYRLSVLVGRAHAHGSPFSVQADEALPHATGAPPDAAGPPALARADPRDSVPAAEPAMPTAAAAAASPPRRPRVAPPRALRPHASTHASPVGGRTPTGGLERSTAPLLPRLRPAHAPECAARGPGLARAEAGRPALLELATADVHGARCAPGGAPPALRAARDCAPLAAVRVTETADGCFELSYVATRAGELRLELLVADAPVPGSPFRVAVAPSDTAATQTSAVGVATSRATAGELARFAIHARDGFGNRRSVGGDDFRARVVAPGGADLRASLELGVETTDCADGTYLCTYTPLRVGAHALHVTLGRDHVRGSPYEVAVSAPPR